MSLNYEKPLVRGTLVARENRFIATCLVSDHPQRVYVPNTGRMIELMVPGTPVWLVDHGPLSARKQRYSLAAAELRGQPVLVDSVRTNQIVAALLDCDGIPGLRGYRVLQREIRVGHSRIDFLLRDAAGHQPNLLLEVKSCTFVANGVAMFPDASSERGERHLRALADSGGPAAVLFVVMLRDVERFTPHFHVDPAFASTLCELSRSLRLMAVSLTVDDALTVQPLARDVPLDLGAASRHNRDSGAYVLLVELDRDRDLIVGSLGPCVFLAGYYLYLGSAKRNLAARLSRHRRRRKAQHWHIDTLLADASLRAAWAVRGYGDEIRLATGVAGLADRAVPGFGASDSPLDSHLFYFSEHPLRRRSFVEWLMDAWTRLPSSDTL